MIDNSTIWTISYGSYNVVYHIDYFMDGNSKNLYEHAEERRCWICQDFWDWCWYRLGWWLMLETKCVAILTWAFFVTSIQFYVSNWPPTQTTSILHHQHPYHQLEHWWATTMLVTDVGNGCWRKNMRIRSLRCWWRLQT